MTDLNVEDNGMDMDFDIELEVEEVVEGGGGGVTSYPELSDLPKLNGKTILGDMEEIDPTVPEWAKQESKPTYSAEEIGAVDADSAISFAEIDDIFSQVFSNTAKQLRR